MQYLGYPIVNDPLYNQPTVWGENNGKNGIYSLSKEQIEQNFMSIHTYEAWIIKQDQLEQDQQEQGNDESKVEDVKKEIQFEETDKKKEFDDLSSKRKSDSLNSDVIEAKKPKIEAEVKPENSQTIESADNQNESVHEQATGILSSNDGDEVFNNNKKVAQAKFDKNLLELDPDCFECKHSYRDPVREEIIMYLHALSYKVSIYIFMVYV